jgi:hypothetical protein
MYHLHTGMNVGGVLNLTVLSSNTPLQISVYEVDFEVQGTLICDSTEQSMF